MFGKTKPMNLLTRSVQWREFQLLRDAFSDLAVEVKCLRKKINEKAEYDYLIKEGWVQGESRYWSCKTSKIDSLYQDAAYKLAIHMASKRI